MFSLCIIDEGLVQKFKGENDKGMLKAKKIRSIFRQNGFSILIERNFTGPQILLFAAYHFYLL